MTHIFQARSRLEHTLLLLNLIHSFLFSAYTDHSVSLSELRPSTYSALGCCISLWWDIQRRPDSGERTVQTRAHSSSGLCNSTIFQSHNSSKLCGLCNSTIFWSHNPSKPPLWGYQQSAGEKEYYSVHIWHCMIVVRLVLKEMISVTMDTNFSHFTQRVIYLVNTDNPDIEWGTRYRLPRQYLLNN